jgi:hypothetical protein
MLKAFIIPTVQKTVKIIDRGFDIIISPLPNRLPKFDIVSPLKTIIVIAMID